MRKDKGSLRDCVAPQPGSTQLSSQQAASSPPLTGRIHELKTWPIPFRAVRDGLKPWELRKDDRDYQVGDVLRLQEWHPSVEAYTGHELERVVTWKLAGGQFGLPVGYCILSLAASRAPAPVDLKAVSDLIDCIQQRSSDNHWWVCADDPEKAVCDAADAIRSLPTPPPRSEAEAVQEADVEGSRGEVAAGLLDIAHHFDSTGYAHGAHVGKARIAREAARLISASPASPSVGGWRPMSEAARVRRGYIEARVACIYRWQPYKPQAARQMKKAGRWQCIGEFGGWENATLPADGEWRPHRPGYPLAERDADGLKAGGE